MSDELIGKTFGGYTLKKLLGHGGMARVYRAKHTKTGEPAALKIIEPQFDPRFDYALRFERESQAIEKLKHPNIVGFHHSGKAKNILFLVMEYIEGNDLAAVLERYRQKKMLMPEAEALQILKDVGAALDYSHQQGVIHRDIKPSNIMINKKGKAILTDFGLALLSEIGTHGEIFGTPRYISPEQAISSASVVPQSDLYALGVIAYEMFTGRVPFEANNPLDTAMMHMTEKPPSPREFRDDLNPALERVLLKVLEKKPNQRYSSGAEFVGAIEKAVAPSKKRTTTITKNPKLPEEPTFKLKTGGASPSKGDDVATKHAVPKSPEPVQARRLSRWIFVVLVMLAIILVGVAVQSGVI